MSNNDNYFDIHSYTQSKQGGILEKNSLADVAIVCLNEDSNCEPYIEINYIDYEGNEGGLTNLEKLDDIANYANVYSSVFEVFPYNTIISILYDLDAKELDLVRLEDYSCVECDLDFNENSISVGYIINKDVNLDFKSKIKLLYEVMKRIMAYAYKEDLELDIVFKIKNQLISNIYGFVDNQNIEIIELSEQVNLAIIESEYQVSLSEPFFQKVKK